MIHCVFGNFSICASHSLTASTRALPAMLARTLALGTTPLLLRRSRMRLPHVEIKQTG